MRNLGGLLVLQIGVTDRVLCPRGAGLREVAESNGLLSVCTSAEVSWGNVRKRVKVGDALGGMGIGAVNSCA